MYPDLLEITLARLHKESRHSVQEREKHSFDFLAGARSRRIVLFGAGQLGKTIARGLRQAGHPALFFSDDNPALWGARVEGLEVLSPSEAAAHYGSNGCFVVSIRNGAGVRASLRRTGCHCVTHFAPLVWKFSSELLAPCRMALPSLIFENVEAIRRGYSILAEDHSRELFCEQLTWRVHLNSEAMRPHQADPHESFPQEFITSIDDEMRMYDRPTLIKMDIKRDEPQAIRSARQVLDSAQPVLAACAHDRPEHLWEIPALMAEIAPRNSVLLRRYAEDCWNVICYAVPQHSLAQWCSRDKLQARDSEHRKCACITTATRALESGREAGIRTPIRRFSICSPAFRRPPDTQSLLLAG